MLCRVVHRKSQLVSIGQLTMVQDMPDCNVSVCIVSEESTTTYQSEFIQEVLKNMLGENGDRIWEKKYSLY